MKTKVYFVQSGKTGPIKIGISRNIEKRLETMQTGNPNLLRLLFCIEADSRGHAREIECWLHRRFKSQHIRGEWFSGNIKLSRLKGYSVGEKG